MDTKGGKQQQVGGGGVMHWEIGIDMSTLMCIKSMTNKNLLYKKVNKIKYKKKIQEESDMAIGLKCCNRILENNNLFTPTCTQNGERIQQKQGKYMFLTYILGT